MEKRVDISKFKPDLIPNSPKGGSFDIYQTIEDNGGYEEYLVSCKKDGCRMQLIESLIKTRSLKAPKSKLVMERFQPLADLCAELNIAVDGEFYMHGLKFNEIFRFFSNEDVTRQSVVDKLNRMAVAKPKEFTKEHGLHSVEWLTTFHDDLQFWLFDGIVLDRPDLVGFEERINEIMSRLNENGSFIGNMIMLPAFNRVKSKEELDEMYEWALEIGFEGLVLTHKNHQYKYGRNTLKKGTILKMKDDEREYDGVVLDVEESTVVKEGVHKTTNELGRSVTSKRKEDREPSGMAKGFIVQYEDVGTFTVSLQGFDERAKRELLANKHKYIGRHFRYTGMPPIKDFPRSAFFDTWRDSK